ncbi:MAG: transposase [Oscillospiraceae bacterium]|nr:transposase [Oscillospiraceae bacterium]
MEEILPEKIAYVDESGIDQYFYREYAYAPRGETVTERI